MCHSERYVQLVTAVVSPEKTRAQASRVSHRATKSCLAREEFLENVGHDI